MSYEYRCLFGACISVLAKQREDMKEQREQLSWKSLGWAWKLFVTKWEAIFHLLSAGAASLRWGVEEEGRHPVAGEESVQTTPAHVRWEKGPSGCVFEHFIPGLQHYKDSHWAEAFSPCQSLLLAYRNSKVKPNTPAVRGCTHTHTMPAAAACLAAQDGWRAEWLQHQQEP